MVKNFSYIFLCLIIFNSNFALSDANPNYEKEKNISEQIKSLTSEQKKIKDKLDVILSSLPNLPLKDVPVGKDESSNIELKKSGKINQFSFKPKSHYEIGEKLKMLDFEFVLLELTKKK